MDCNYPSFPPCLSREPRDDPFSCQLIAAVTLVESIYFAAISFSDLRKVMAAQGTEANLRILLFVSPIILWLVCLFFAVQVFMTS